MIRSCSAGNWFLDNLNFLQIAKIIDNNFIDSDKTFRVERKNGVYFLSTNKCDDAPIIAIDCLLTDNTIEKIEKLHSDGWQEITKDTYKKVEQYLLSLF